MDHPHSFGHPAATCTTGSCTRVSTAHCGGRQLDRSVRKSVHSPNSALQYDDKPKTEVQNDFQDSDERQTRCHSALEPLTLPLGPATWGIQVEWNWRH